MTADVVEFTRTDIAPLLARMDDLAERGAGWINIGPGLTAEEFDSLPSRSTFSKWVAGRGPAVPMSTWTPAERGRRAGNIVVGIEHGTGPNAIARLGDGGVALPDAWQKRQDHAKNGIVVELPPDTPHEAIVEWILAAMVALSPRVEIGHDWIAEVYVGA